MTSVNFQFEKDNQTYEIELQSIPRPAPDAVFINGMAYKFSGDTNVIKNVRDKIPELRAFADLSFESLETKLISIGARNVALTEKTHRLGIKALAINDESKALLKAYEIESAQRFELQQGLKLLKTKEDSDVEQLKSEILKAKQKEMDSYLKYLEKERQFRGAVLVKQNSRRVLFNAYGPSNERGDKNSAAARFCIGSMTKQFTGASIALLIQNSALITDPDALKRLDLDKEAKLDLKTPIKKLLPSKYWSDRWEGVALEDLVRHTSGLPCYGSSPEDESRQKNFTLDDLVGIVKGHELYFDPGEMNSYSNGGYVLLGAIIENLSGKSLESFMRDNIFIPLGMNHTGMLESYDKAVAEGFEPTENEPMKIPTEIHLSKTYGAGGIISTLEDLEKWDEALYDSRFFTEETKALMFSCPDPKPRYDQDRPELYTKDFNGRNHLMPRINYPKEYYGFGICLAADENILGHGKLGDILWHNGDLPGFASYMGRYIPSKSLIVVLENCHDIETKEQAQDRLEKILFS